MVSIHVQLPKIASEKSKMLTYAQYRDLLSVKTLNEFVIKLKKMDYEEIELQENATLELIDFGLKEKLIVTLQKIIRNSPEKFQRFFMVYLLKFEIENIKLLIKSFYKNLVKDEIKIHESIEELVGRIGIFKEALMATDMKALLAILRRLPYGDLIIEAFITFERENYSFFYFDLVLDLKYLEELWLKHQKLNQKDSQIARQYVGFETDCYNLEAIVRARNLKVEPSLTYKMISAKNYHLNKQFLESLMKDNLNYEKLAEIIGSKEKISNLDANSIRIICKHARVNLIRSLYVKEVFSIGKSLAFFLHKELEIENLRTVSVGIYYKRPLEEILSKIYIV